MTDAQKRSYETLMPVYGVPLTGAGEVSVSSGAVGESAAKTQAGLLDFPRIFGNDNPVVVEIGFGMGIATAQIAEVHPDTNYIGIEVHTPGIGRLLWEIERRQLKNIRIIEHDAVEVLERAADASVSGFHIFFPDPWPKKRHHKRRLIQKPFTETVSAKLKSGGYIYMVTDWAEYGDWSLAELSAVAGLKNAYNGFAPPQTWRPKTKFEQKGLQKGHEIRELLFKK
jgi:tRNA (guanine-N7-)-methyltransferase